MNHRGPHKANALKGKEIIKALICIYHFWQSLAQILILFVIILKKGRTKMEDKTIKHLNNFNEMLYQRLQDVEHRLERLKIICASLGANDFSEITSKINTLSAEFVSLKQTVKTNDEKFSNLDTKVNSYSYDINTLNQKVTDINSQLSSINSNISDISHIRDRSLSNEASVANLKNSFENYKKEHAAETTVSIGRIELRLKVLEQSVTTIESEINTLNSTILENTSNISNNANEINTLKTQLENQKIENELSFILNGTYISPSDIETILNGTYIL